MRALALALFALALPATAQTWEPLAPLQTARTGAAVVVLDGQLFALGGRGPAGQPLDSAERYDPATDTWVPIAPMRDEHADGAAAVYQGQIVMTGGREGDGRVTDDAETYDALGDDWDSFDHLETAREGHGAIVLDGDLYALGGASQSGALLGACEYYADNTWETYAPWALVPGRARFGLADDGGTAIVAGGFSAFGPVADVDRYTLGVGSAPLDPLPSARGGLALVAQAGVFVAVGGRDAADAVLPDVLRYAAGTWTPLAPLPAAREDAGAALIGGDLYVVGGADALGSPTSTLWRLAGVATSGETGPTAEASRLRLAGPNPVRSAARVAVTLRAPAEATVDVVDGLGREVARLHAGPLPAGETRLAWAPGGLAAGPYLVRLRTAAGTETVRLTLLR